jgi:hypothetical protein
LPTTLGNCRSTLVGVLWMNIDTDEFRPLVGQSFGNPAADIRTRAGYQRHFVLEFHDITP